MAYACVRAQACAIAFVKVVLSYKRVEFEFHLQDGQFANQNLKIEKEVCFTFWR